MNKSILQLYQTCKISLEKDSRWIIDSVMDHNISILNNIRLAGSSYIKLPKGLINIENVDDNECFKWCLVKHLNPPDRNLASITKANNRFAKKLDFKGIKFPVNIHIHKIEKKNSIGISVFVYENKENIQFIYQKDVAKKSMLIYY